MVEMFPHVLPLKRCVVLWCVHCIHFKCSSLSITKVLEINTLLKIYQLGGENLPTTKQFLMKITPLRFSTAAILTLPRLMTVYLFFFFLILHIFSPDKTQRCVCSITSSSFSTASINGDSWVYFAYVPTKQLNARDVSGSGLPRERNIRKQTPYNRLELGRDELPPRAV